METQQTLHYLFNISTLIGLTFLLMASITTGGFKYDVFLSFRGEDTRHGFTGYLWKALNERGIHAFIDDEGIQKGEEITPTLVKAIDESRMTIIVLSENYASSSFCLQELSQILECIKEKGRCVWPFFYDVDPSDVQKLTGTYGEAMAKHKAMYKNNLKDALSKLTDIAAISYKNDNKEKLKKWKNSLQKVANLSGISYKNDNMEKLKKWKNSLQQVAKLSGFPYSKKGDEYEYELIEKIVQKVSSKINPSPNYRVKTSKKPRGRLFR